MPKPIKRTYVGADAVMTESSRTIFTLFTEDQDDFEAFDSTLDEDFLADYETDLEAAEGVVQDTAVEGSQMQLTETVEARMNAARAKYAEVAYFVRKTFPDSEGTQREFGLDKYDRVRKSQPKMVEFLDLLSKAALEHALALKAKGYSDAGIAGIATVRAALLGDNTDQEVFKRKRPRTTEDRIKILNAAHDRMALVNAAAGIVYAADPVKRAQYTYAPYGNAADDDVDEYSDNVGAGEVRIVLTMTDYDADRGFTFRNVGSVPLRFYITVGGTTEEAGTPVDVGPGDTIVRTMQQLNPETGALTLVVKNLDADNAGAYEVAIDMDGADDTPGTPVSGGGGAGD